MPDESGAFWRELVRIVGVTLRSARMTDVRDCPTRAGTRHYWPWLVALAAASAAPSLMGCDAAPGGIVAEPRQPVLPSFANPDPSSVALLRPAAPLHPASQEPMSSRSVPLLAKSTPLSEQALAVHIALAWHAVVGQPVQRETLAVLWAHSALETGRGQKMIGFNFAGLKGQSPNGDGRPLWTWELSDRGMTRVRRTFRVYPDARAGALDYVQLLTTKYGRARRAAERGSPSDFVTSLATSDYFTHDTEQYTQSMTSLTLEYLKKNPAPTASRTTL
jgi:hypothetical protein